jgi:hypothetical protein
MDDWRNNATHSELPHKTPVSGVATGEPSHSTRWTVGSAVSTAGLQTTAKRDISCLRRELAKSLRRNVSDILLRGVSVVQKSADSEHKRTDGKRNKRLFNVKAHQNPSPQKYDNFSLFTYITKYLHFLAMYLSFVITAAQHGSRGCTLRRPGFNCTTVHVVSAVDNVIMGLVFSEYYSFPCQIHWHQRSVFPCHLPVDNHALQKSVNEFILRNVAFIRQCGWKSEAEDVHILTFIPYDVHSKRHRVGRGYRSFQVWGNERQARTFI